MHLHSQPVSWSSRVAEANGHTDWRRLDRCRWVGRWTGSHGGEETELQSTPAAPSISYSPGPAEGDAALVRHPRPWTSDRQLLRCSQAKAARHRSARGHDGHVALPEVARGRGADVCLAPCCSLEPRRRRPSASASAQRQEAYRCGCTHPTALDAAIRARREAETRGEGGDDAGELPVRSLGGLFRIRSRACAV